MKNSFIYKNQIEFLRLEGSDEAETEIIHKHLESCESSEFEDTGIPI